ncbi:MAG: DUF2637 domain-containing protein, partial [Saccharopolyspora sp.]|uniref:DUF2637 domain-containing protein n=1 Tax=Saccharopolyspora sp. TaxID=33915 RepID=UPI0025EEB7F8
RSERQTTTDAAPSPGDRGSRSLSVAALIFVAAAAVMGWGASFVGLHEYGMQSMAGFTNVTAWLVPATFDGAAFACTLMTYRSSINGRSAVRGRILMWAFTGVSSWINWIHQPSQEAQIVAAGLPIAAVAVCDVVLLELRADYEAKHGMRGFRLRPGLLVLRWMVDRKSTSVAFRNKVIDIPVEEIAGLGTLSPPEARRAAALQASSEAHAAGPRSGGEPAVPARGDRFAGDSAAVAGISPDRQEERRTVAPAGNEFGGAAELPGGQRAPRPDDVGTLPHESDVDSGRGDAVHARVPASTSAASVRTSAVSADYPAPGRDEPTSANSDSGESGSADDAATARSGRGPAAQSGGEPEASAGTKDVPTAETEPHAARAVAAAAAAGADETGSEAPGSGTPGDGSAESGTTSSGAAGTASADPETTSSTAPASGKATANSTGEANGTGAEPSTSDAEAATVTMELPSTTGGSGEKPGNGPKSADRPGKGSAASNSRAGSGKTTGDAAPADTDKTAASTASTGANAADTSDAEKTLQLPPVPDGPMSDRDKRSAARSDYRTSLAADQPVKPAELGKRYGLSESWGRRQINAVRKSMAQEQAQEPADLVGANKQ